MQAQRFSLDCGCAPRSLTELVSKCLCEAAPCVRTMVSNIGYNVSSCVYTHTLSNNSTVAAVPSDRRTLAVYAGNPADSSPSKFTYTFEEAMAGGCLSVVSELVRLDLLIGATPNFAAALNHVIMSSSAGDWSRCCWCHSVP